MGGRINLLNEQDPLHTIKTEFDAQPSNFEIGVSGGKFAQGGIQSAHHMGRKKRVNQGSGGYLSEAFEGPSINDKGGIGAAGPLQNQRNGTAPSGNKTLNAYSVQQYPIKDKVRGGSLSFANHKYN